MLMWFFQFVIPVFWFLAKVINAQFHSCDLQGKLLILGVPPGWVLCQIGVAILKAFTFQVIQF